MRESLTVWFDSPVTMALAAAVVAGFFVVFELLASGLARLGNVRFQGILEDHPKLLPAAAVREIHLSTLTDILRWIEIALLGVLWLIIARFAWPESWHRVVAALVVTAVLVLLSRISSGSLGEDTVARLLQLASPLVRFPLALIGRNGQTAPPVPSPEDEDEEAASEREIQAYLEAGQAAGIFEGEEGEFVESLVDFFDTVVREVMTPRTEMVTVPDTISLDELIETFAETLKSRIPVYHDTIDKVTGIAHVKNCVQHVTEGSRPAVADLVHPCLVVPETKELGELLRDFQQSQQQMAIVVDEYGGTSGLVTLEDILEEIVGEIEDEHDSRQPPESQELDTGVYRLQGRAPLEVLGDLYDREIDEEDIDSVGGLVFSRHGTVPKAGTEVTDEINNLVFVVDEMDERRIVSVTVQKADVTESAGEDQ